MSEAKQKGYVLEIRSRQTFRGEAEPHLALGVFCPTKALDIPLEQCTRCQNSRGPKLGSATLEPFVFCDAAADELDEALVGTAKDGKSVEAAQISSIMTTRVICVGPDLSLVALAALFLDRSISGAPVVDESGRAIGMVSKTDLVRHHHDQETAGGVRREHVVADIMMPMAFVLPANDSVARAAALMVYEGMHRVPVVNAHGQIVGLLSPLDVMRWMARKHGYVLPGAARP